MFSSIAVVSVTELHDQADYAKATVVLLFAIQTYRGMEVYFQ